MHGWRMVLDGLIAAVRETLMAVVWCICQVQLPCALHRMSLMLLFCPLWWGTSVCRVSSLLFSVMSRTMICYLKAPVVNPRRGLQYLVCVLGLCVCLSVRLSICYRSSYFSVRLYLQPTILRGFS